jgi:hypothetical protein
MNIIGAYSSSAIPIWISVLSVLQVVLVLWFGFVLLLGSWNRSAFSSSGSPRGKGEVKMRLDIPAMLFSLPALWLTFVLLYGSFKVFTWLRKWNP